MRLKSGPSPRAGACGGAEAQVEELIKKRRRRTARRRTDSTRRTSRKTRERAKMRKVLESNRRFAGPLVQRRVGSSNV